MADTQNHRIQKFDAAGKFLLKWGAKGEGDGQFTEPWGIAVDKAGNVYVADTFNYRIQKFDASGKFLAKWGSFVDTRGQAGGSTAGLYGPRAIAIDRDGNLWVTDTGNKRLMKYDKDGKFLAQFGSVGTDEGRFNEPVGLAIDPSGNIYVADTWNQRIQKFDASFKLLAQWPVAGWEGGSVLNKPYLAADARWRLCHGPRAEPRDPLQPHGRRAGRLWAGRAWTPRPSTCRWGWRWTAPTTCT